MTTTNPNNSRRLGFADEQRRAAKRDRHIEDALNARIERMAVLRPMAGQMQLPLSSLSPLTKRYGVDSL